MCWLRVNLGPNRLQTARLGCDLQPRPGRLVALGSDDLVLGKQPQTPGPAYCFDPGATNGQFRTHTANSDFTTGGFRTASGSAEMSASFRW